MVLRGKKGTLPSRPPAPSVQDMVEDVNAAAPEDRVFCPAEEISGLLSMYPADPARIASSDVGGDGVDVDQSEVLECFVSARKMVLVSKDLQKAETVLEMKRKDLDSIATEVENITAELWNRTLQGS
uniref:UPF0449 protein C19orf25 homolog n=1 Tax=Myxine glutinosa TaxID=7769 RepID=UPI00358F8C7A